MMFFLIMNTPGIIVIPVSEELDEHLLNVVQRLLAEPWRFAPELPTVDGGHHYRYQPYAPTLYLFVSS